MKFNRNNVRDWKYLLQQADVIVSAGHGIDSYIIKTLSNSHYSHSCIYIGNSLMIEATYPFKEEDNRTGVMISHVSKYDNRDKVILRHKDLTLQQKEVIKQFTLNQVGKKFSHKKMLAVTLPIQLSGKEEGWFCSEIICAAYKTAGVELMPRVDRCLINPSDFITSSKLSPVFRKLGSTLEYYH